MSFIDDPPDGVSVDRIVKAVGSLRVFWSPKTDAFARGLLRGTGFLRLKKRPKPVRGAVRTLLRTIEEEATTEGENGNR